MGASPSSVEITDVPARAQCQQELRHFTRLHKTLKQRPLCIPDIRWTPFNHKLFSREFKERFVCLLCCLRAYGLCLPKDIIGYILSMISISDDVMAHVVQLGEGKSRVYSFNGNRALDVMSRRDCDGETHIVGRLRQYPNTLSATKHTVSVYEGGSVMYWTRLRDGSDFSWRTTEISMEDLQQIRLVIFGDVGSSSDCTWCFDFLKSL